MRVSLVECRGGTEAQRALAELTEPEPRQPQTAVDDWPRASASEPACGGRSVGHAGICPSTGRPSSRSSENGVIQLCIQTTSRIFRNTLLVQRTGRRHPTQCSEPLKTRSETVQLNLMLVRLGLSAGKAEHWNPAHRPSLTKCGDCGSGHAMTKVICVSEARAMPWQHGIAP